MDTRERPALTPCPPRMKRGGNGPIFVLCDHRSCYVLRERVAG